MPPVGDQCRSRLSTIREPPARYGTDRSTRCSRLLIDHSNRWVIGSNRGPSHPDRRPRSTRQPEPLRAQQSASGVPAARRATTGLSKSAAVSVAPASAVVEGRRRQLEVVAGLSREECDPPTGQGGHRADTSPSGRRVQVPAADQMRSGYGVGYRVGGDSMSTAVDPGKASVAPRVVSDDGQDPVARPVHRSIGPPPARPDGERPGPVDKRRSIASLTVAISASWPNTVRVSPSGDRSSRATS